MKQALPWGMSLLVLLSAFGLVMVTVDRHTLRLVADERQRVERLYVQARERELQHYVLLARAATERIAAEPGESAPRQRQALAILARMRFGQDGYFFVYDRQGRTLLDPEQMDTQGVAFCEPDAVAGGQQAQLILDTAGSGGGLVRYAWARPASMQPVPKMSYVTTVEPWGWTLGAGLYLDEVQQQLQQLEAHAQQSMAQTHRQLMMIAALAIALVGSGWLATVAWQQHAARRRMYRLLEQLGDVREGERQRLARELHDGVVQVVVSSRHLIEAAQQRLGPRGRTGAAARDVSLQAMLQGSLARLDEALGEIRRVSRGMLPHRLQDQGLHDALASLVAQWQQELPLRIHLQLSDPACALGEDLQVALLRITQEALANVSRHAQARQVWITVSHDAQAVRLSVRDDGRGFDMVRAQQAEGVGLRNLRSRAQALGGSVHVHTSAQGTQVEVMLPRVTPPPQDRV